MSLKVRTARLSIYSNSLIIVITFIAGILSGAISLISEAIHTIIDLLAAIMAFVSIKIADSPPDKTHPYGHGKFENISGVIEGLLIVLASLFIIVSSVYRIIHPIEIHSNGLILGFIVMAVSAIINGIVGKRLMLVGKKTDSIALKADALHLSTHVYTSVGVGIALLLTYFTDWDYFDPIAAICVALYILHEAYEIIEEAFSPLTDASLNKKELRLIENVLEEEIPEYATYVDLKTRKSGAVRFIEFQLTLNKDILVREADGIKKAIISHYQKHYPNTQFMIEYDLDE